MKLSDADICRFTAFLPSCRNFVAEERVLHAGHVIFCGEDAEDQTKRVASMWGSKFYTYFTNVKFSNILPEGPCGEVDINMLSLIINYYQLIFK